MSGHTEQARAQGGPVGWPVKDVVISRRAWAGSRAPTPDLEAPVTARGLGEALRAVLKPAEDRSVWGPQARALRQSSELDARLVQCGGRFCRLR